MRNILYFTLIFLTIACGNQQSTEEVVEETTATSEGYIYPEANVYLAISDSIGIEMGDSNYVFGSIATSNGVGIIPVGEIVVLDMQKSCISLFSPEGEFIKQIGRHGSGPGEFLLPVAMTIFPDGGLAVSDAMAGKLIYFNSDLEYESDISGFFPSPPSVISGLDGGAIVGVKPEFQQNEEGMFMGFAVARWEPEQVEPSVVYLSNSSPFNPDDLTSMQEDYIIFGTAPDGVVITSLLSSEVYEFVVWNSEGDELYTIIDESYERVLKTQEEIDIETELSNRAMIQQGMPPEMANWEPDPYRSAVGSFAVDGQDRLWVRRGTIQSPFFDVYDLDGNHLFTSVLDYEEADLRWIVCIEDDKFVAYDAYPEYYQQIFIGDLPE